MLTGDYLHITGLTDVGRATERVLAFNSSHVNGPVSTRHRAILHGIYPPAWARDWGF
jgi:hypothetical protein